MADSARVVELITTIAADPALRSRLAAADDATRATILDELGFGDITATDVAANAETFVPRVADELDDTELESVAGGADTTPATTVTTITAAASAAVAT